MLDVNRPARAAAFDTHRLDELLEASGADVMLATSKHNVQYLFGGHRAAFFDYMDAIGVSRYLPILIYVKGDPAKAGYIGHRLEKGQFAVTPYWVPEIQPVANGSLDAMQLAIDHIKRVGLNPRRIAAELAFLPMDAGLKLKAAFPDAELVDAQFVLERLRARKTPQELELLRVASDLVIDSMLAVVANHGPGTTKRELVEALRREETSRGLIFEYCLIAAGTSLNRAPSEQRWEKGDVLSLDSGGNYHGYIGDLARMAILGEPDTELEDLLGAIEEVQQIAFKAVAPGARGGDVYVAAEAAMARLKEHNHAHFIAHGMGLASHEAPRLTSTGPIPYDAYDADRPLETGMVLSIETTLEHSRRGFIKLEDTVIVTEHGHDVYGNSARGWNRGGTALAR